MAGMPRIQTLKDPLLTQVGCQAMFSQEVVLQEACLGTFSIKQHSSCAPTFPPGANSVQDGAYIRVEGLSVALYEEKVQ